MVTIRSPCCRAWCRSLLYEVNWWRFVTLFI